MLIKPIKRYISNILRSSICETNSAHCISGYIVREDRVLQKIKQNNHVDFLDTAGCGGKRSNHISIKSNAIKEPRKTFLFTELQKTFSIGAKNRRQIYEGINQFELVIKKKSFNPTCCPKEYLIITFITIQKKHRNTRFINDIFFGSVEK